MITITEAALSCTVFLTLQRQPRGLESNLFSSFSLPSLNVGPTNVNVNSLINFLRLSADGEMKDLLINHMIHFFRLYTDLTWSG